MLAPSMPASGPTSSPPRWAVSSAAEKRTDRKVEVGVGIRLVLERVVPPLAGVRAEAPGGHDRVQGPAVRPFDGRDAGGAVVGDRIHQVVVATHRGELTGGQVIERQVDGAPPAVPRPGGDIS